MTEPTTEPVESGPTAEVGYECHDCGALYPLGAISQCELPEVSRPAHQD